MSKNRAGAVGSKMVTWLWMCNNLLLWRTHWRLSGGGSGSFPSENDLDNFRFEPGSTALDGRMNKDSEGYITLQMARK